MATRGRRPGRNAWRMDVGGRRPDRMALWAVVLSVFSLIVAAASAYGASGGIGTGGGSGSEASSQTPAAGTSAGFGARVLRVGMAGDDVRVLNGIVKSKGYASGVRVSTYFERPTKAAVKKFQGAAGLPATGVVSKSTSKALVRSMTRTAATWYGPGLYGNRMACGKVLRHTTVGVAHRTLPCGTKVTLAYRGRYAVVRVIDRGPFAGGYEFDLTSATADAIGFSASGNLRYAVARRGSDLRGL